MTIRRALQMLSCKLLVISELAKHWKDQAVRGTIPEIDAYPSKHCYRSERDGQATRETQKKRNGLCELLNKHAYYM